MCVCERERERECVCVCESDREIECVRERFDKTNCQFYGGEVLRVGHVGRFAPHRHVLAVRVWGSGLS